MFRKKVSSIAEIEKSSRLDLEDEEIKRFFPVNQNNIEELFMQVILNKSKDLVS